MGLKLRTAVWQVLRLTVWLLVLMAGVWSVVQSESSETVKAHSAYSVDIDTMINPGALAILQNAIDVAEQNDVAALIVRINTPGGVLSSTRDMVSAISESNVPVIGYVGPVGANAGSAGAFILLSTHVAVMNQGTNLGASSPVDQDGGDIKGTMGKKIMNDSKAFMRSIADKHQRNAEIAEKFVSEAASLTAKEAFESNVIDLLVENYTEVLSAVEGREIILQGEKRILNFAGVEIKPVKSRLLDRLLVHIAQPQIAHLLISLGTLAIYIEIISPGLAFPGVLGVIAVVLGLMGMQTLPVNTGFLALLILGIVLMVSEYFVAGFGVLGIGGAIAFVFGSLCLFNVPYTVDYQNGILSISLAVSVAMLLTAFLITHSITAGPKKIRMDGKTGEAMMNFDNEGYVLIENKRWSAITTEALHHGDRVVVLEKDKAGCLRVKKIKS